MLKSIERVTHVNSWWTLDFRLSGFKKLSNAGCFLSARQNSFYFDVAKESFWRLDAVDAYWIISLSQFARFSLLGVCIFHIFTVAALLFSSSYNLKISAATWSYRRKESSRTRTREAPALKSWGSSDRIYTSSQCLPSVFLLCCARNLFRGSDRYICVINDENLARLSRVERKTVPHFILSRKFCLSQDARYCFIKFQLLGISMQLVNHGSFSAVERRSSKEEMAGLCE